MTTISKAAYRHLLDADASPEEVVIAYHERTKHHFHRYAASLGCMDWTTQPDPFRRYPGADLVRLLLPKQGRPLPYWQLYLERRAILDAKAWTQLCAPFPEGSFLVGLASVHWREAWKYGERAFRYCQHDAGHALATVRIAAAALGWGLVLLDGVSDSAIAGLFGLSRGDDYGTAEREEPELLALVTCGLPLTSAQLLNEPTAGSIGAQWNGRANTLSPEHRVEWPVIDEVAQATRRSESAPITEDFSRFPTEEQLFGIPIRHGLLSAETAILGRRSAVAMDGSTAISQEAFFRTLARLIPTRDRRSMPWDAIPWRPRVHLGLFVHRVDGVPRGLYALARDQDKLAALQEVMRREFRWQHLPSCPPGLPLYLLQEGDCRALAATVSCGQHIAGDGAFSVGMIVDYMDSLTTYGAAFYRNLFWEAGMVGQMLYLEAEETGIRSTGIGCYFDDPVHEVFGITSRQWQSFYHFTVGGQVEDTRLTTLPSYDFDEEQ